MGITIAIVLGVCVFLVGMRIRDKWIVTVGGFLVVLFGFLGAVTA